MRNSCKWPMYRVSIEMLLHLKICFTICRSFYSHEKREKNLGIIWLKIQNGYSRVEKRVQPFSEPFLPIWNLPHLCGKFFTKNQLFPTGNEDSRPSFIFGVESICGADMGELTLVELLSRLFTASNQAWKCIGKCMALYVSGSWYAGLSVIVRHPLIVRPPHLLRPIWDVRIDWQLRQPETRLI